MPLFIVLALLLLPVPAFAGDPSPSWMTSPSGNVTVLHQPSGIDYAYDMNRNSATIYPVTPTSRWYSAQDAHGKITQGYLFDPMPRASFGEPFSTLPSVLDNPYQYTMPSDRYPSSR